MISDEHERSQSDAEEEPQAIEPPPADLDLVDEGTGGPGSSDAFPPVADSELIDVAREGEDDRYSEPRARDATQ